MPGTRKISNKEFLEVLTKNAGIYSRTVQAIKSEFGVEITRQTVRARALRLPKHVLEDIHEQSIDIAEEGLQGLMKSKNEDIKLKAVIFYLKTKGKNRGYSDKTEVDITSKGNEIQFAGFDAFMNSCLTLTADEDEEKIDEAIQQEAAGLHSGLLQDNFSDEV